MDEGKRRLLIAANEGRDGEAAVGLEQFFDGNDDLSSIGCNLTDHPGIDTFCRTLEELSRRDDVSDVRVILSEVNPGPGCWPFSDLVVVAGSISEEDLRRVLKPLIPSEIGAANEFGVNASILSKLPGEKHAVWWD